MSSRLPIALLLCLLFSGLSGVFLQKLAHDLHHLASPGRGTLRRHHLLSPHDFLFNFLQYLAVLLLQLLELSKGYACSVQLLLLGILRKHRLSPMDLLKYLHQI